MSKDNRGGEPVAWQWLDTAHFRKQIPSHSNAEEWRPLFTAPQPTEPSCNMGEHACNDRSQCWEPCGDLGKSVEHAEAAPAQEPSIVRPVTMREICPDCGHQFECFHNGYINELRAHAAPQPAEPVKVPSDDDLHNLWSRSGGVMRTFARALLARYGQPAEPEGWKLVPMEPTDEILDAMHESIRILVTPSKRTADIQNDVYVWASMLEAAPKFGEEE